MVHIDVSLCEKIRLGVKVASYRFLQYRMRTDEKVVISTNYGDVEGVKRRSLYDKFFYSFEGIPYAKPPLGKLRFRAPQKPTPWQDVRDCTSCAKPPKQKHIVLHQPYGSEDCLYLNVYVKRLESDRPLPVMVWIFGGAFQVGEATRDFYAPDYFMEKEVVVVTLNYRLGALGFLSLRDPAVNVPGNAGLKDQVMALRWVNENIRHFNGDNNNITLFGESAGAASVHSLMLSDKTEKLFHKAIVQSGSAMAPWINQSQRDWPFRLAIRIGYKGMNNDKDVYNFLSTVESDKIVQNDNSLLKEEEELERVLVAFTPVVEPYECEDSLLTRPYRELLDNAWTNSIPLVVGYNSAEGLLARQKSTRDPWLVDEAGDCEQFLPPEVKEACDNEAERKALGRRIKKLHFGNQEPNFSSTFQEYLEIFGYRSFLHGAHRTLLARSNYASNVPTYFYRFDVDSPFLNHFRILTCGRSVRGVSHADDLSYLWFNANGSKLNPNTMEYKAIERMIDMWTSFASTSDPNCRSIMPTKWEPIKSKCECNCKGEGWMCLNISEKVKYVPVPEWKKLQVWDTLFTKAKLF